MCVPSFSTTLPFTSTVSIPTGYWNGSSKVALSATVFGSKITRSAHCPSLIVPRSLSPRMLAGSDVIFRIASCSGMTFISRT